MSAKYTFLAWETPVKDASTKLALLQIANNSDDNGFSYYSISKMAKSCDMSERNFMRKIKILESMKVLIVERRANRPSLYTLVGDEMGVTICHLQNSEVTTCHAEVTTCHAEGDNLSHDPNTYPNTYPKSKDLLSKDEIEKGQSETILEYFNIVTNSKLKASTRSHVQCINARLKDGYTAEELIAVIDHKTSEWGDDVKMAQYLRPSTIFQTGKFDGYLKAARLSSAQPSPINSDVKLSPSERFRQRHGAK